ncbi:hypothetical protein O6H91_Y344900 [Diphasiastrum complanatum]|nr:hypothetical protein O6H91_Y344900 [Diphasiastrum complanatum]KAJ7284224.1 hypothetical protein O6H91_Y344900 [Diphasiastrum complanatum]
MANLGNPSHYSSSSTDDDLPVKQPQRLPVKKPQRLTVKQPERLSLKQLERVSIKQPERRPIKQPERVSVKMENVSDSDALEDSESAEKGLEVCQVGEELCAVPYELFDLPDLTSILSLDAWNFSLTEEERESLTAFLPPLEDETAFKTTLKELLRGENFHFGSPLSAFFDLLKNGFFQPQVARHREGLKYLQRKEHYHSLRKYHNRMVNSFHEMQKLWEDYPDAEIDERIEIWNSWKIHKVKPPVAQKPTEKQCVVSQKDKSMSHSGKKVKLLKSKASNKKMVPPEEKHLLGKGRTGPKGVLRVKAAALHDDKRESSSKQEKRGSGPGPRGVLKVARPKTNLPVEISATENLFAPEARKLIAGRATQMVMERDYREINEAVALQSHDKKRRSKAMESIPKKRTKQEYKSKEETILAHRSRLKQSDLNDNQGGLVEKKGSNEIVVENLEIEAKKSRSKQDPSIRKGKSFDRKQPLIVEVAHISTEAKQFSSKEGTGIQVGAGEITEAKMKKLRENESFREEKLETNKKRAKKGESVQRAAEFLKAEPRQGKQKSEKKSKSIKSFDNEQNVVGSIAQVKVELKEYFGHAEEQKLKDVDRFIGTKKTLVQREPDEVKKRPYQRKKVDVGNKGNDFGEKAEKDDELGRKASGQESNAYVVSFASSEAEVQEKLSPLKIAKRRNANSESLALISSETDPPPALQNFPEKGGLGTATKSSKKLASLAIPSLASTLPFSVRHLLSAVRLALLFAYEENGFDLYERHSQTAFLLGGVTQNIGTSESSGAYGEDPSSSLVQQRNDFLASEGKTGSYSMSLSEILKRVQKNPGDRRILETEKSLQDLIRGALKVFSSKTAPAGVKGWKPLASYDKIRKSWSWIGPPPGRRLQDSMEQQISPEAWGLSQKTILKMEEMFANWFNHGQENLQQIVSLPLPPPPPMPIPMDEKERFRELRAQKSLITIAPSSEDARAYFRMEELRRYSLPDRAFTYTAADGQKSIVAPLRRCGVKLNSKARDHFMLKPDRPSHVTILCLVRDAAARLPKSIGTRADVSALIRDSQFIMEDVSDAQVNQVVSGALDRLHYERDPCVRFDGERKLWVYLHADRHEEDFEDDGTSSTKRWKRPRKDALGLEAGLAGYDHGSPYAVDQDLSGNCIGLELNSPDGMDTGDATAIYSAGSAELVYSKSSSLTSPRVIRNGLNRSLIDDESIPFMELPPSVQSGYADLQNGSLATSWNAISKKGAGKFWRQGNQLDLQEELAEEDYDEEAAACAAHLDAGVMLDADTD